MLIQFLNELIILLINTVLTKYLQRENYFEAMKGIIRKVWVV